MFRVTPVACMITSAARIESGMLIAATSVARMLNRNRKIVRTANRAPRPPSRTQAVAGLDDERREVGDDVDVDGVRVLGLELVEGGGHLLGDLDGVRVGRLGHGQRQGRLAVGPRVAGRRDAGELDRAEVADRDRRRGGGRDGRGRRRRGGGGVERGGGIGRRGGRARCVGPPGTAGGRRDADDEVLDLLDALDLADRRDRDLRVVRGDLPGREGQVVRGEDARDLGERHVVRGQLLRVERDQHLLDLAAREVDAGDALEARAAPGRSRPGRRPRRRPAPCPRPRRSRR